jgi:hypothetical protein
MAKYRLMLVRQMSQALDIEAPDLVTAAREAMEINGLSANISNDFDDSGEVEIYQAVELTDDGEKVVFEFERDGEIDLQ